jgi:hypothetical protein
MTVTTIQRPTIGRVVVYRSRTGDYDVPAVISATQDTLFRPAVDARVMPDLESPAHVHLTVFTPGPQGKRHRAENLSPAQYEEQIGRSENQGGSYQEWQVPYDADGAAGTWRYPDRVTDEIEV